MSLKIVKDWVSYPWRIDNVSRRLSHSTTIHSPSFPGAGRRWQLSLVARTVQGHELDALPLYITVIEPKSLVVKAAVDACVLVGSGWSSLGVSDKRVMIDVNENKMGTVLVDDKFLSRAQMGTYKYDNDDAITIRCKIHVFDDHPLDALLPPPHDDPFESPALPGIPSGDGRGKRKSRRDDSTSTPSKRLRTK